MGRPIVEPGENGSEIGVPVRVTDFLVEISITHAERYLNQARCTGIAKEIAVHPSQHRGISAFKSLNYGVQRVALHLRPPTRRRIMCRRRLLILNSSSICLADPLEKLPVVCRVRRANCKSFRDAP